MKYCLTILGLFLTTGLFAQQNIYPYQSLPLQSQEDGYALVELAPAVNNKIENDWRNLRVYDEKGQETPYIIRREEAKTGESVFKDYKIVSHEEKKGCCTIIVIENQFNDPIDNILMKVRSFDLLKVMSIKGSDDQKNWYGIRNKWMLHSTYSSSPGIETQFIPLPTSIYKYYQIRINDRINPPLKVEALGFYTNKFRYGSFAENDTVTNLAQKDSTKVKSSFVDFSFKEKQYIDLLKIGVEGPVHYLREAKLFVRKFNPQDSSHFYKYVGDIDLSSESSTEYRYEKLQGKDFRLVVENNDSPPLIIRNIRTYQLKTYAAFYMKARQKYSLFFGAEDVKAPVYDLEFFRNQVLEDTSRKLIAKDFVKKETPKKEEKKKEEDNTILYIAIAAAALLMLVMSIKMVKDMKKNEEG